jgi:hypothetical protein
MCLCGKKTRLYSWFSAFSSRLMSNAERRLKNVEVDKSTKYGLEFFSHLDT